MIGLKPWDAFLNMEETHKGFFRLVEYALKEAGGFLWPILYGFLYWYAMPSLSTIGQSVFVVLGAPLIIISFLYSFAWKKYDEKREVIFNKFIEQLLDDYKGMVEHNARSLVSKISSRDDKRYLGIEDQDVRNLYDSLQAFESKYCHKN